MNVEPITLEGQHVRLEPLSEQHGAGVLAAATSQSIFQWMSFSLTSEPHWHGFLKRVSKMREAGSALPFAIIAKSTNMLVGTTGYWHIEPHHHRLEIGGSWLTPDWQRTAANSEAKFLLLRHAFETLGCIRVEFVTHVSNEQSKQALIRLGATHEGVLRNHMIQPDGSLRHSACFSIIREEWPDVKHRMEQRMAARAVAQQSVRGGVPA